MKILMINTNQDDKYIEFDLKLNTLKNKLTDKGAEVCQIQVRDLNLKDCIGCYACWLKTPGVCSLQDDMESILKGFVGADVVITASPVKIGFVTPLCKRVRDRMLPIVHPYLMIKEDRMSHVQRYDSQPKQMMVLDKKESTQHIESIYGQKNSKGKSIYYIEETEALINEIING